MPHFLQKAYLYTWRFELSTDNAKTKNEGVNCETVVQTKTLDNKDCKL